MKRTGADSVEQARGLAWAALNRREHTVAELRALLKRRGADRAAGEVVVAELVADGYLDDAGYAERFAADRRNLDGWGSERIARGLQARGVADGDIAAAVDARDHAGELDAAVELLAGRFPAGAVAPRDLQRMFGLLARKGYGSELAYDAVRRHAGAAADL